MNFSFSFRTTFLSAFSTVLACTALISGAAPPEQDHPALKRKFDLPPSAELNYSIKARQSGLTLGGNAIVKWIADANKFVVETETRAMIVGKILVTKSEGGIDEYGLAPTSFIEKRLHRDLTTTSFNRTAKTINFSESTASYSLIGGEQDRNSAVWQLVSIARGAQSKFKSGSEWAFFVAGQRDAEAWTFHVDKPETIRTPLGDMTTVHIVKAPPPNAKGQQLDIWLAPSLEWYPVRLRFTEADGDYIEQTLDKISKQTP